VAHVPGRCISETKERTLDSLTCMRRNRGTGGSLGRLSIHEGKEAPDVDVGWGCEKQERKALSFAKI